jgi:MFS family permease
VKPNDKAVAGSDGAALNRLSQSLGLLFTRKFGTYWFATLLSNLGFWAQQVAEPWLLLDLHASAFVIGLDAFMLDGPQWVFTLLGGVLADHADRRRVIALFQTAQMLCPLALVVLVVTGVCAPWMVVVLAFFVGVTDSLSMPSYSSIVPAIVEHDRIPAALALNSIQFNLSRILGPAIAGGLIAALGVVACFAVNAASYIPFVAVALWILPRGRTTQGNFDPKHPFTGLRATLADSGLRGALLTVLASGTFAGPLVTFAPVLVRQQLEGGAGAFSATVAGFGVGGLAGAAVVLALNPARDRRVTCSILAVLLGVLVAFAGLNPWLWVLPAIAALAGAAMTMSNTLANAIIQQTVSDSLRGQAISMYMLALRGGVAIGAVVTGAMVHLLGMRNALVADGVGAAVVQLLIARSWRRRAS